MSNVEPRTAVFVGENALTVGCAERWLAAGHEIAGVASDVESVREWARLRGIRQAGRVDLLDAPFDYLFSVVNLRLLPAAVLRRARRLAVNFHDGLLPVDAGLHASAWAILRGATTHGVTWHVMTERADAGDVLVQRRVEVGPDDTSWDLNTRCFAAGLDAFGELVDRLDAGTLRPAAQDLHRRTYHGAADRPTAALTIDWTEPAGRIAALVRATAFGPHANEFGTAKIAYEGGRLLSVGGARVSEARSTAPPGTVVGCGERSLTVATATHDLVLDAVATIAGLPVNLSESVGRVLPALDGQGAAALTAAQRATIRHERAWVTRLATTRPMDVPYRQTATPPTAWHRFDVPATGGAPTTAAPPTAWHRFDEPDPGGAPATAAHPTAWHQFDVPDPSGAPTTTALPTVRHRFDVPGTPATAAAVCAFLARIGRGEPGDIGLRVPTGDADGLLAPLVPFAVPALTPDFTGYAGEVAARLDAARASGTYLRDVFVRHPRLHDARQLDDGFPIELDLTGQPAAAGPAVVLRITVDPDGSCRWWVADSVAAATEARALVDAFAMFRSGLAGGGAPDTTPLLTAAPTVAPVDYPRDRCIHQLIADQVDRTPDVPAVTSAGQQLTYRQLHARTHELAAHIAAHGVGPGDLVGVSVGRTPDLVATLLAVLRTGAAYVPLDPVYPPERIATMLDDARVRLLVADSAPDPRVAAAAPAILHLGQLGPAPAKDHPDAADPDDRAYVIYTSGSTGRPKGVQIGHRALTNFLSSMVREPGLTAGDRMLAVTTVCFDIAVLELFGPLLVGGAVHLADADTARDGHALCELIGRERPTVLQATPVTWKMLIAAGWGGSPGLRAWCGGEALTRDLADGLRIRAEAVWNLYGPTETTVWSTVSRVVAGAPITLGQPVANTRLYVLDDQLRPLPVGVPGELCIGGDGVADGYLDRPTLTADRFRQDPFADQGRLYRTGDLVRRTAGGALEFLGRTDHQVKIRGFRIELGEIEAVLAAAAEVGSAVVVARRDDTEATLAAYVTAAPGRTVDIGVLRAAAGRRLPDYMVPASVTVLDALPLTANGKVDRGALPAPALTAEPTSRRPETVRERQLCALFGASLGRDIGSDDDYFAAGGDSLRAVGLISAARDAGLVLTVADLFAAPTAARLAARLDGFAAPQEPVDLVAEVSLAPEVVPRRRSPRHVLLTGATGFLGAFLLHELAADPAVRVTCVVRSTDGLDRIRKNLRGYGLAEPTGNVDVRIADLAVDSAPTGLPERIDTIVHAAADVHFLRPYHQLAATNVGGTRRILEVAADTGAVVHHLSSMGVFGYAPRGAGRATADAPLPPPDRLVTGYQRSKWVAEGVCEVARSRGIPVTIHRLARVSGAATTGACQRDDFLWRILKGCVQIGGVPADTDLAFDLVPVDHAARAIADLVRLGTGGTHHQANPVPVTFTALVDQVRRAGYPLTDLDRRKWTDLVGADPANAAHALVDSFAATAWGPDHEVFLEPGPSGATCPAPHAGLLETYVDYFRRTGFLP
ncbi:amino acid adenylation domain-containing protein/thioester reductase-like protein [Asanoa ferruginea]|uniref:Amino acid adenylation domain-containing protein/thioester reductase-like protein n=1 Tax=Asanoa ferruginea TaxID=53367 RepID=A0A3D9ZQX8_9ACTN|nr:amino acid adenylation domain-containing protein [Asanoa ferruginea]REF99044.1 amino acid adenylation domain-containing protein/thioester reductase-like protein [Asanoa ferruginea]GIF46272.1 hypothetical protein Afe04nite_08110 [Asanoa ferruginea]